MIDLFVAVCLAVAHGQCAPEVQVPIHFSNYDTCDTFVRDAIGAELKVGGLRLAFRCAVNA